jgi:hypothetical protein
MRSVLPILLALIAGQLFAVEEVIESGPVVGRIRVEPDALAFGDLIELTIEAKAEPDVELLMPDFGEALDHFVIREFVPRHEVTPDGRTRERQTYSLETPLSGDYTIPSVLIEYVDRRPGQRPAPEDQDAYELTLPPIPVHVKSMLGDGAQQQLRAPRGILEQQKARTSRMSYLVLAAAVTAIATLGCVLWCRRLGPKQVQRSAYSIAREALDRLISAPLPVTDQLDAFYVKLSAIVRNYLENRFGLRAPELTTEEFLETLSNSPDLDVRYRQLLREFLRQADLVKFAGAVPAENEIRQSLEAAHKFIEETHD